MGQILHGSARTTKAVRRAIQHSQESIRALAGRYGINPKTVAKWKRRTITADAPMGPKAPSSTVLTLEQEAIIVAFRKHTLLPLDDCLYALQATIPHLTRSSLHRCLQRHGISRLPEIEGDKPNKKKFKAYPIGFFHIDIAEVRTEEGKLYLFVAIDRTSKIAFARLEREANRLTATAQYATHMFSLRCRQNGIEHRLTKPNHPWTNGQVERMNRTLKEATVKRYHYESHNQLREHLAAFLAAYNFAKRLKTLRGLTPHEYVCKMWNAESATFRKDPTQFTSGLYT
jgi:transposase InsO family protein